MYVGVRAGGGIGDEIEDPAGDDYELYRVVFDITFFFFVIVILLAIIQGSVHIRSSQPTSPVFLKWVYAFLRGTLKDCRIETFLDMCVSVVSSTCAAVVNYDFQDLS